MKKIILFLVALVSTMTANLQAQDFNKGGRTAFQFTKIGIGARQAAMGEASISHVRDVNAVFWNPANLSGIQAGEASFSYVRWLADMNLLAGAVGWRWQGVGVFALSYAALDYGDIDEALAVGGSGSSDTRTGNVFTGSDLLFGFSFAREFTDKLAIGLSAKFLQEKLFNYSETAFAFDAGTSYEVGFKSIRLAMSLQNFSVGSAKWLAVSDRTEGYDIPLLFKLGASVALAGAGEKDSFLRLGENHRVLMSIEAINSNDYDERIHLGGEYTFGGFFALRGGYRMNYEEGSWSFGLGLQPRVSNLDMRIDYAYVSYEFLDSPHRLTASFAF